MGVEWKQREKFRNEQKKRNRKKTTTRRREPAYGSYRGIGTSSWIVLYFHVITLAIANSRQRQEEEFAIYCKFTVTKYRLRCGKLVYLCLTFFSVFSFPFTLFRFILFVLLSFYHFYYSQLSFVFYSAFRMPF